MGGVVELEQDLRRGRRGRERRPARRRGRPASGRDGRRRGIGMGVPWRFFSVGDARGRRRRPGERPRGYRPSGASSARGMRRPACRGRRDDRCGRQTAPASSHGRSMRSRQVHRAVRRTQKVERGSARRSRSGAARRVSNEARRSAKPPAGAAATARARPRSRRRPGDELGAHHRQLADDRRQPAAGLELASSARRHLGDRAATARSRRTARRPAAPCDASAFTHRRRSSTPARCRLSLAMRASSGSISSVVTCCALCASSAAM